MAKYKVGEIVVITHTLPEYAMYKNSEATIVGFGPVTKLKKEQTYELDIFPPWLVAEESVLRRKRPPADEGAREWFEKNINTNKTPETISDA